MPKNIILTADKIEKVYCTKIGNRWKYTTVQSSKKLGISVATLIRFLNYYNIPKRGKGNVGFVIKLNVPGLR